MAGANRSAGSGAASMSERGPDAGLHIDADHLATRTCASHTDHATRGAILQALDLPAEAIPLFLQHIEQFCHAHGGEQHYSQLLALLAKYRDMA